MLAVVSTPAAAQEDGQSFTAQVLEISAPDGVLIDGREYRGHIRIIAGDEGLVIVESVDPDRYLYGIREMPASWHPQALQVQAVAARTYLAWTLARGRVGAGSKYGFDICATTQCQVYRGSGSTDLDPRWQAAVDATSNEILIYDDSPAQTLYSSTTGGRTRNIEDVWGGGAKPYLVAVESPNEPSPFVDWSFSLTVNQLDDILEAAGEPTGVTGIVVEQHADGDGPWEVVVRYRHGSKRWSTWGFRNLMNRYAPKEYPEDFPAWRTPERRYPQVVLGPTFSVTSRRLFDDLALSFERLPRTIEFAGHGWGHLVGMSQYGAQQMAVNGFTYDEILNHYYTGLFPEGASEFVPAVLKVGLTWDVQQVALELLGPATMSVDGVTTSASAGEWEVTFTGGAITVQRPGAKEAVGRPDRGAE